MSLYKGKIKLKKQITNFSPVWFDSLVFSDGMGSSKIKEAKYASLFCWIKIPSGTCMTNTWQRQTLARQHKLKNANRKNCKKKKKLFCLKYLEILPGCHWIHFHIRFKCQIYTVWTPASGLLEYPGRIM